MLYVAASRAQKLHQLHIKHLKEAIILEKGPVRNLCLFNKFLEKQGETPFRCLRPGSKRILFLFPMGYIDERLLLLLLIRIRMLYPEGILIFELQGSIPAASIDFPLVNSFRKPLILLFH
jgi:hypothetical protein